MKILFMALLSVSQLWCGGWDSNGMLTREKLEELGLLDLADDLGVR